MRPQESTSPAKPRRSGGVGAAILVLLAGILIALIVLIVVLIEDRNQRPAAPSPTAIGPGLATVSATTEPAKPVSPKPDPRLSGPGSEAPIAPHSLYDTSRPPPATTPPLTEGSLVVAVARPSVVPPPGEVFVVSPGETVTRDKLPESKMIGDDKLIQQILREGRTYDTVVKGVLTARVEDKDWGAKQTTTLVFEFEMPMSRLIESNNGTRVVEVRHFGNIATAKALTVEAVTIELGAPGALVLGTLGAFHPGIGPAIASAKTVAEAILRTAAKTVADQKAKAWGNLDSLSGKTVRIVYVDGHGVQGIEPLEGSLTASERDYLFNLATLSECYELRPKFRPGETWTIEGGALQNFLDPTMRAVPHGAVIVVRGKDQEWDGKQLALLDIQRTSYLEVDSSDSSLRRIASFAPRGTLRYNIAGGYVETGDLTGDILIEKVSKRHLLFPASFLTKPDLKVSYWCRMR